MEENISREAGRHSRTVHQSRRFPVVDPRDGPHPRRTEYNLLAHSISRLPMNAEEFEDRRIDSRPSSPDDEPPAPPGRPIAVIGGTGPAGMGLALRWARAGETVIIGSRNEERAQQTAAAKIQRKRAGCQRIRHGEQRRLRRRRCHSDADRPVQSSSNAAQTTQTRDDRRQHPHRRNRSSRGQRRRARLPHAWRLARVRRQQAAELVPKGVSLVAAFHNVSAEMLNGDDPLDCDVIVCSNDADASQLTRELAARIPGVRALDGGPLRKCPHRRANHRVAHRHEHPLQRPRRNPHHRTATYRLPLAPKEFPGLSQNKNLDAAWQYHSGTKHSPLSVRMNPHFLDWDNKPLLFKIYPTLEVMRLPRDFRETGRAALDAIAAPAARNFSRGNPESRDSGTISLLLCWRGSEQEARAGGNVFSRRGVHGRAL